MSDEPDYYRLADGRYFWQFYAQECAPFVSCTLNDGEKHALQSACEHLFRRGFKGSTYEDTQKARWWLNRCCTGFKGDDDVLHDYAHEIARKIAPVIALVECRRMQKMGALKLPADMLGVSLVNAETEPSEPEVVIPHQTAWGAVAEIGAETRRTK